MNTNQPTRRQFQRHKIYSRVSCFAVGHGGFLARLCCSDKQRNGIGHGPSGPPGGVTAICQRKR